MTLARTGVESDTERWEEHDHSAVEYRAADGAVLRFEAFAASGLGLRQRMGAKIVSHHERFEFAEIDSSYVMRVDDRAYDIVRESSSGKNATHLEQHESKHGNAVTVSVPKRVDALCRAQWRGARYRYVVSIGRLGPDAAVDAPSFPEGFPQHWSVPGGVEVSASSLDVPAQGLGRRPTAAFTLRNRGGAPQRIMIHPASAGFEVGSGEVILPARGSLRVPVRYLPRGGETVEGSVVIDTPSGSHLVELIGHANKGNPIFMTGGLMGG